MNELFGYLVLHYVTMYTMKTELAMFVWQFRRQIDLELAHLALSIVGWRMSLVSGKSCGSCAIPEDN